MSKVKQYINEFLYPSKASYVDNLTVNEALRFLNIVEVEYYDALLLRPTSDHQIHLRRPLNSCFTDNCNSIMLKAWRANMDSQPVFDYYEAVFYMSACFSKSDSETSQGLLQACSEVRSMNLNAMETMDKLASSYLSSRQVSLQEAVYYSLLEL